MAWRLQERVGRAWVNITSGGRPISEANPQAALTRLQAERPIDFSMSQGANFATLNLRAIQRDSAVYPRQKINESRERFYETAIDDAGKKVSVELTQKSRESRRSPILVLIPRTAAQPGEDYTEGDLVF